MAAPYGFFVVSVTLVVVDEAESSLPEELHAPATSAAPTTQDDASATRSDQLADVAFMIFLLPDLRSLDVGM